MDADGVSLTSIEHPRSKWYVRPYWSWRCLWAQWFGFKNTKIILLPVCEEEFSTGRFRYRLRVPKGHALNQVYGTKGE